MAPKRKAPLKRKLAEEFPPGEVLVDTAKKQWKLGTPIGKGGFGLLYLADENSSKPVSNNAPYVVKVEPSDNGPLFSELKFYMRAAKPELIQKWITSQKLKYLGVPKYWGSGLHEKNGNSYRFMVMDRFGSDLQKIFESNGKRFSHKTVLQLGLRLLDILEYIHEHEYVHGDIKASNLLLSHKNTNQVYLVDYGLAYRYCPEGIHKEYKEDPKRCHDGTIELTSIDAHKGVAPSRRGDLEILGYCMMQWLCGSLPWEDKLTDPNYVRDSKIRYRDNISSLMTKCFSGKDAPEIAKYLEYVKAMGYTEKPQYKKLREIFLDGLKSIGAKDDDKLDLSILENGSLTAVGEHKKKAAGRSKKTTEPRSSGGEKSPKKKAGLSNPVHSRKQEVEERAAHSSSDLPKRKRMKK
ncbi:serine/threonine-protein kinase VRK1 [Protopterus annectens]|uniref:serine/threonine-protein kinase VRK1 n=1 Tax=Protopterus annectens TaxID=7888 RepID=UPI001CF9DC4F|nr:serine/threonine-protein kinase VRK1 [Protopterus annectens]XP_043930579.1 serine/threonine-protein kinase VRK1 [Protopterus annectens]